MAKVVKEYLHLSSGVDYIEYQYFDDNGNPAEENAATKCIILECDKDGKVLRTMNGIVKPKKAAWLETLRKKLPF